MFMLCLLLYHSGDGEITLKELAEALDVKSMIIDTDGDGVISEQEEVQALLSSPPNLNISRILQLRMLIGEHNVWWLGSVFLRNRDCQVIFRLRHTLPRFSATI